MGTSDESSLVDQITRVARRTLGLTDEAIRTYYVPKAWGFLRD